jgi:amino acid transporter
MPAAPPAAALAPALSRLAQGTLLATYCYWGYYNITFLGSEVRDPKRTIPRAILISVLVVASLYVLMDFAALPSVREFLEYSIDVSVKDATVHGQLVADIARSAFGQWAGYTIAALIVWTAFASVFSLLLGYSRVPYAAARDGNYFRFLAAVHPRHGIPHRSLVALGLVACCFCFFSLAQVITWLVITRILLQFMLQQVGVIVLRVRQPDLPRPFRIPLYPLPPLAAIAGFVWIVVSRATAWSTIAGAAIIGISGTMIYLGRARMLNEWPFAKRG